MGIPRERVRIVRCGDVLAVSEDVFEVIGHVQAQGVLVDGLGVGDVGNIVLRDRQHLSENGLIVVALTLEHGSNQLLAGPDIISRGFVYVRESESLLEDCRSVVEETLEECLADSRVTRATVSVRKADCVPSLASAEVVLSRSRAAT